MVNKKNNKKGGEQMGYEIVQLPRCICERCGNKWIPRTDKKPLYCPACRSYYWDKPRRNSAVIK